MADNNSSPTREVLFELRPSGRFMRVTAIDPVTGIEVVSVCDASYSQAMMQRLAARKLFYVLKKRRQQSGSETFVPGRRGILA